MANTSKKGKSPATTVFHSEADDGTSHVVGIGNLRVVIIPDGDVWFAQGLEIDYAAQGSSVEDAKKQFEDGLIAPFHRTLFVRHIVPLFR